MASKSSRTGWGLIPLPWQTARRDRAYQRALERTPAARAAALSVHPELFTDRAVPHTVRAGEAQGGAPQHADSSGDSPDEAGDPPGAARTDAPPGPPATRSVVIQAVFTGPDADHTWRDGSDAVTQLLELIGELADHLGQEVEVSVQPALGTAVHLGTDAVLPGTDETSWIRADVAHPRGEIALPPELADLYAGIGAEHGWVYDPALVYAPLVGPVAVPFRLHAIRGFGDRVSDLPGANLYLRSHHQAADPPVVDEVDGTE